MMILQHAARARCRLPTPLRVSFFTVVLLSSRLVAGAEASNLEKAAAAAESGTDESDDIISLAAYNVKADLIEDFGLRVESERYPLASQATSLTSVWLAKFAPQIVAVVPNTAADKAGLKPGDRILKSEGRSTIGGPFSRNIFDKLQKRKWAEVAAGKTDVTWTLEIEAPATKLVRTVTLVVPTPAPHWGASAWQKPAGRSESVVNESGPLTERSRSVLDNGIWALLPWPMSSVPGGHVSPRSEPTATGFQWRVGREREGLHQIWVTQAEGRTHVFFETSSASTGRRIYLTSPSGKLEKAWWWGRKENIALMQAKTAEIAAKVGEVPLEQARAGFEHELDLWTTKVGKVSARWPFELKPGTDANAIFAVLGAQEGKADVSASSAARPLAADFLNLPIATDTERALLSDAGSKLGAQADRWAYSEKSRGLEDRRELITRVDPSQPEANRVRLVSIDGKVPTPDEVQRWREDGGETPRPLGDFPPLARVVELADLRIFRDEPTAVIFEAPVRAGSLEFPAEKFQALLRVNKAQRAFEAITLKLREPVRVGGVAKMVDAGWELRFQTIEAESVPQPVWLKAGVGARVLLVKMSRTAETTRTDFTRVVPFGDPAGSK